jgi:hypothetical protein
VNPRAARGVVLFAYALTSLSYAIVGVIAAHPFDVAIYAQHAQYFYFMNVNPAFSLPMGLYYDLINIGGYFVTILFSLGGISNVLTIQIGVKIPLILFTFMTAYFLYKIIERMGFNGHYASLILLTSPIYFFTSVIYGSALVVSMFFLVSSVYFLFSRRTFVSAILFGIAVGSYLYPVFSIPFLLRYLYRKEGKRNTLIYLLLTSAFAALGQLTVLYFYLRSGYYSVSPNSPSGYLSAMPVPYYSVFDIFNIIGISKLIPGEVYNYVYYFSAIIASFSYFLVKKEKVNEESLLVFFLIQGVLFASLNPYNLPSYMSAVIPFAILLAIMYRRWVVIGLLWISSFLSFLVMQTINSVGFLIYFSDVNLKILNIRNVFPSWFNSVLGFLYSFSLLLLIPQALKLKAGKAVKFKKTMVSQASVVATLVVVAIIILVPVISSVPSNMYLEASVNTSQALPVSESLLGDSLSVEYKIPVVGLLGTSYVKYFIGEISTPSTFYVIYNDSRNFTIFPGNFTAPLDVYFPIEGSTLELFGTGIGLVNLILVNETSITEPNFQFYKSGDFVTYKYIFNSTLSGSYTMKVSSSIPLYCQNQSSISIFLGGFPDVGNILIGKHSIPGGYIPGYLLKSSLTVKYTGPFSKIPPFIPSISVYPNKNLFKSTESALLEGGTMFLLLILVPPILLAFYRTKELHSRNNKNIKVR